MFPAKFAPYLVGLMMSAVMTFFVSGFATYRGLGLVEGFMQIWMEAWIPCWFLAFPIIMLIGPIARKIAGRITAPVEGPDDVDRSLNLPTSKPQR
ncbi:DUF2798 domain-containing protein [Algirhabdus cladophorae]|uniref:DUF2798 domain-containing protein n=1 Tax=Algirhabdus cladophorae TaxID=3377108 RepID=UPI003B84AEDF